MAIISLLIAILLPAIGKAKDGALVTQSVANLNNLGKANATYGADWQDRQFTACPDDVGSVPNGDCNTYITQVACPPQQILGWDDQAHLWGYWVGGGLCPAGQPGGCYNWIVLWPNEWVMLNGVFGSWRMPNVKVFNDYVNGKYYDRVFWAPKDRYSLEKIAEPLTRAGEFSVPPNPPIYATYCWSPAAMWSPDLLSSANANNECNNAGKPGQCGPGAWRSPPASAASYPDLKTRMIEHQWLQNKEGGEFNPGFGGTVPWLWNQGYNSAPATLYFDGHVTIAGVSDAMEADARSKGQNQNNGNMCANGKGLWHRGTPLGTNGYYSNLGYDMLVNTNYHVMTTDGIQGRDVTGAK